MINENFPERSYKDVPGLCKVASIDEIEVQGWSLNPGRYVGVKDNNEEDYDFREKFEQCIYNLESLNKEGHKLEELIIENALTLLEENK